MSVRIYTDQEKKELSKLSNAVKHISVAEIADNLYGLTLYKSKSSGSRYLKCYEHPSLLFDLKKNLVFYNAKTSHGMSGYDFIAFYEGISHLSAREKLNEYYLERDPRNLELYFYNYKTEDTFKHKGLLIPPMDANGSMYMRDFLLGKKISSKVIDMLVAESSVFLDKQKNVVFLGYDENAQPSFAMKYGTGEKPYKAECDGSYTRVGFSLVQENVNDVIVCDSIINGLSLLTMNSNYNILCSVDIEHLKDTVDYAFEKYDFIKQADSVQFAIEDSQFADSILQDLQSSERSIQRLDIKKFQEEYFEDNDLHSVQVIEDHKDMNDLLNQLSKQADQNSELELASNTVQY